MKTIILTGGSSSLGAFLANHFANKNFKIINIDQKPPENKHPNIEDIICDLNHIDQIKTAFHYIQKKILNNPKYKLHGFIANAGKYFLSPFHQTPTSELLSLFQINLFSHTILLQKLWPYFLKNQFGRIILLGSEQSIIGRSYSSIYAMTKAALAQMARSLAAEVPPNIDIRINTLCPSGINNTGMDQQAKNYFKQNLDQNNLNNHFFPSSDNPTGSNASLKSITRWIDFLLSPEPLDAQGSCILVDNGLTQIR